MQREGQSGQASLCGEGEKSENRIKGSIEGTKWFYYTTRRRGHCICGACMGNYGGGGADGIVTDGLRGKLSVVGKTGTGQREQPAATRFIMQ